jgi:hypothetical protein
MNKNDLKEICFRVGKKINKCINESGSINPQVKNFFKNSSLKYIDNEYFKGITLNEGAIDVQSALEVLGVNGYNNTIKNIATIVNKELKKEKLLEDVEFIPTGISDRVFEMDNRLIDADLSCLLVFKEAAGTAENIKIIEDERKMDANSSIGLSQAEYYIEPIKEGQTTNNELVDELINDYKTILANRWDNHNEKFITSTYNRSKHDSYDNNSVNNSFGDMDDPRYNDEDYGRNVKPIHYTNDVRIKYDY